MTKQFRNNYETIVAPAVAYQLYNPLANPPRKITLVQRVFATSIDLGNPAPNHSAKEHAYFCFELNCLLLTFPEETWSQFADFLCFYDSSVFDKWIQKSLDGKKHVEVVYLATKKVSNQQRCNLVAICLRLGSTDLFYTAIDSNKF